MTCLAPAVSKTQVVTSASPAETAARLRILIVDGDILTAEATTSALASAGVDARFMLPVSASHLHDLIAHWRPARAFVNLDSLDDATARECMTGLLGAHISTRVGHGEPDLRRSGELVA
jgi:hypothetical protein